MLQPGSGWQQKQGTYKYKIPSALSLSIDFLLKITMRCAAFQKTFLSLTVCNVLGEAGAPPSPVNSIQLTSSKRGSAYWWGPVAKLPVGLRICPTACGSPTLAKKAYLDRILLRWLHRFIEPAAMQHLNVVQMRMEIWWNFFVNPCPCPHDYIVVGVSALRPLSLTPGQHQLAVV